MKAPERTTAEVFPRYIGGEVLADSATLKWPGLFARRCRFPRVVDGYLVPATAEPLITCTLNGSAEFQERDIGGEWLPRQVRRGDIFVTGSKTPYELRWRSPLGAEMDEMLSARTAGNAKRVASFAQLLAIHIAEKYTNIASQRPDYRGGLPIARLRKIEDYVRAHLAESISVEALAEMVELSPFHFSRVFKHATGMSPLQFVTRERIVRAQQLVRETSRSLIEIALEVGYTSPSHFAQVFRRVVGVAPTEFRSGL